MTNARELAEQLGAELEGDEDAWDRPLERVAPLDSAVPGCLSFLSARKYESRLADSRATAILVKPESVEKAPATAALIIVADPYLAYARVSHRFNAEPRPTAQLDRSALIAEDAVLGAGVTVEAGAVIGSGVVIGDACQIGAGAVLETGVRLGTRTRVMANVTLCHGVILGDDCRIQPGTVVGSEGFGFAADDGRWQSIAQLGIVRIGNRVDIGANVAIDRGALEDTVIEDDVIIDNLVHIAHNVRICASTAIAGQVGIAGSTTLGQGCTVGGQAGFAGHIDVADGAHFTGQSMVTKSIREPGVYSSGWPAQPSREWRRTVARLRQLDQYEQRLKSLERKLASNTDAPNYEDER